VQWDNLIDIARKFFSMPEDLQEAFLEAERRENLKEDPSPDTFDGKGSFPSFFSTLEDVLKERGLKGKALQWFGGSKRV
jgi:hypothetical protein